LPTFLYDTHDIFWIIVPGALTFPLMLLRKIGEVRFLAIFGFLTIVYATAVVVFYSLNPSNNDIDENIKHIEYVNWTGAATTFPLFLFGFTCQNNVLDAYQELQTSNVRRMKKVTTRQFLIVTTIYIMIGLFGYFNYPLKPAEDLNILQMYNPATHYSALIAIVLLTVAIIVPMPLLFKPMKDCLASLIYPSDPANNWIHYPLSAALVVLNIMLCCYCVVNNIGMNQMLTYVSGVTAPLMC